MPVSPYFKKVTTKNVKKAIDKGVPDCVDVDLRVLFVGINPGLTSTARGHHFAGPTNHFWPCLSDSGLVTRKLTFSDDVTMVKEFGLGITNLTPRTTRSASELTRKEQHANAPALKAKISSLRPKVACFVGKGIYDIYSGKRKRTSNGDIHTILIFRAAGKKSASVKMGLQPETITWADGNGETKLFVMPSTSGIVSAYQKPDKLKFFQQLCQIVNDA
ncbi:uracil-DNA glycosylase-like protein [Gongronella butleri]|nr:uracil-DNA glycosylase-like protein [Gongronella butleri]